MHRDEALRVPLQIRHEDEDGQFDDDEMPYWKSSARVGSATILLGPGSAMIWSFLAALPVSMSRDGFTFLQSLPSHRGSPPFHEALHEGSSHTSPGQRRGLEPSRGERYWSEAGTPTPSVRHSPQTFP